MRTAGFALIVLTVILATALPVPPAPDGPQGGDASETSDPSSQGMSPAGDAASASDASSQPTDDAGAASPADRFSEPGLPEEAVVQPDATPYEMTVQALGEPLAPIPQPDPSLPLSDALALHPATEGQPQPTPLPAHLETPLSRLIQAHGTLTELMDAASAGDAQASSQVPYAAARLATVGQDVEPTLAAASDLGGLAGQADLQLRDGDASPVEARDLDRQLERLSGTLGIPAVSPTPVALENEAEMASLVAALDRVLEATAASQAAASMVPLIDRDADRVSKALAQGDLTEQEARMVRQVTSDVEDLILAPTNARLDAVQALEATVRSVAPSLSVPASHGSQPIFVDPLGLVAITGEDDDVIHPDQQPPEGGAPLFPTGTLLHVDLGGDDRYEGAPAVANGTAHVLTVTDEGAGADEATETAADTIEGTSVGVGFVGVYTEAGRKVTADQLRATGESADTATAVDADLAVPEMASIVVDLGGNDTYVGDEVGVARGGATTAIVDAGGDDRYEAAFGLGSVELDGFSLLSDDAGDDTYAVDDGLGSVLPQQRGTVPLNVPTLAAFVDRSGNDTYSIGATGGGVALYNGTLAHLDPDEATYGADPEYPASVYRAHAIAMDLGHAGEGFGPRLGDTPIPPSVAFYDEGRGDARYWEYTDRFPESLPDGCAVARDDGCLVGFEDGSPVISFTPGTGDTDRVRDESEQTHLTVRAVQRAWHPDVNELSRESISQQNASLEATIDPLQLGSGAGPNTTACSSDGESTTCAGLSDPTQNGRLVIPRLLELDLGDTDDTYDGAYPAILVDAAGDDAYADASPRSMITRANASAGDLTHPGVPLVLGSGDPSLQRNHHGALPMFVLDLDGDDTYTGETAHVRPRTSADLAGQYALVADLRGDDTYEGTTGGVTINLTEELETKVRTSESDLPHVGAMVVDRNGSDVYDGPGALVGGTRVERVTAEDAFLGPEEGDPTFATSALLLDGGTARNNVTAGDGSMGSVVARPLDGGVFPTGPENVWGGRLISAAVLTGPTTYEVTGAALATVDFGECVERSDGCKNLARPMLAYGVLLGSQGSDVYRVDERPALGDARHETGCDSKTIIDTSNPVLPNFVTRFVDLGGSDLYHLDNATAELPPWGNDRAWDGTDCDNSLTPDATGSEGSDGDCEETFSVNPTPQTEGVVSGPMCDEDWERALRFYESLYREAGVFVDILLQDFVCFFDDTPCEDDTFKPVRDTATEGPSAILPNPNPTPGVYEQITGIATGVSLDDVDDVSIPHALAQGIDNVAQFALRSSAGTTASTVGRPAQLNTTLCVGDLDDPRRHQLILQGMRCNAGSGSPTITERDHVAIASDVNVPANLFEQINPCDVGRSSDDDLGVEIHDRNSPRPNPRAAGLSGCWATLTLRPDPLDFGVSGDEPLSNPTWRPTIPSANDTVVTLESPVTCTIQNANQQIFGAFDPELPLPLCMTDAFPLPQHVGGTDGYDLGRVPLPEGEYDYQLRFRGPIATLLGQDAVRTGVLTVDVQDPFFQGDAGELLPPTGFSWLEDVAGQDPDAKRPLWENVWVHPVSQDATDEPEQIEVWSPIRLEELDRSRELCPAIQIDGTLYAADPKPDERRSSTWNRDLGTWMTRYELAPAPGLARRLGLDTDTQVTLEQGVNEVRSMLLHVPGTDVCDPTATQVRVLDLPEARLSDALVVDQEDPEIRISPLNPDVPDAGAGIAQMDCPESTVDVIEATSQIDCLRFELPIEVTDASPIRILELNGTSDRGVPADRSPVRNHTTGNPLDDEVGRVLDGQIRFEDRTFPCDDGANCTIELNRTGSGQADRAHWFRDATVNLTITTTGAQADHIHPEIVRAIQDATRRNEPFHLELNGSIRAVDEAGNVRQVNDLQNVRVDLSRPSDIVLGCDGHANQVRTDSHVLPLKVFTPDEDTRGIYVETSKLGEQSWTRGPQLRLLSTLDRVDLNCDPDGDRLRWFEVPVNATELQGVEPGDEATLQVRTVALDPSGNTERSATPFDAVATFDLKSPTVNVTATHAEPTQLTATVEASEPVRVTGAALPLDGRRVEPDRSLPTPFDTGHELRFTQLPAGENFTLDVSAVDRSGHAVSVNGTVETASTLNVTLADVPAVAGDEADVDWIAGALGPTEGGDPGVDVELELAGPQGPCSKRVLPVYVSAPPSRPARDNATVSLTDCPAGPVNLTLRFTNDLETVTLARTLHHDVEVPRPQVNVTGPQAESGWYTGPATVRPAVLDDAPGARAWIERGDARLSSIDLSEAGTHEVTVVAEDAAGRTGRGTFEVRLDRDAPQLDVVPRDPLPAEGDSLAVDIQHTDDASGVRSVRFLQASGAYGPWIPVLDDISMSVDVEGRDTLVAQAIDRAGHMTRTTLPLQSLDQPPKLADHRVRVEGPGAIDVDVDLDRPMGVVVTAVADGSQVAQARSDQARTHDVDLTPVPPGSALTVRVDAQLASGGEHRLLEESVVTPPDQALPTAPADVDATPLPNGVAKVTWSAATDDSGVDRYVVERTTDGHSRAWITSDTSLVDHASPGREHTYRVKAIDLADRESAWSAPANATPGLETKLVRYSFQPEIVQAGEPVTTRVVLQASDRPEAVEMAFADRTQSLHLVSGAQGTWVYEVDTTFEATDVLTEDGVRFRVGDDTLPANGTLPGPVVQSLATEATTTPSEVPLGLLVVPLTLMLTALAYRRRWNR